MMGKSFEKDEENIKFQHEKKTPENEDPMTMKLSNSISQGKEAFYISARALRRWRWRLKYVRHFIPFLAK